MDLAVAGKESHANLQAEYPSREAEFRSNENNLRRGLAVWQDGCRRP
jgi:hypothetical protein